MNMTRGLLMLLLVATTCVAYAQSPTPLAASVSLNGEARGTVLLLEIGTRLFVDQDDARSWRLRLPSRPDTSFRGRSFYSMSALELNVSRFDRAALQVELRAEPSAFESSAVSANSHEYRVTPAAFGGFSTYDLIGTRTEGRDAVDGVFTLGGFTPMGSLTHQFIVRHLWSDDHTPRDPKRIATNFRHDWPDLLATMELGDTYSRPGAFGRPLRYGGINIGTNFGLRPGFIRQPLPDLSGEVALPGTVDVFVQNQLRAVTRVPAGPFTLDNVPLVLGAGDARLVMRDALGRESIITSSFYVAGGLLRKGLSEWGLSAGGLRSDTPSKTSYGNTFSTALFRRGLTSNLTMELRGEYEEHHTRVIGGALDFGGLWGEAEITGALADAYGVGTRGLVGAGYLYRGPNYNFGLRWTQAQRGFRLAGDTELYSTPHRTITTTFGQRLSRGLNFGAAWIVVEQQSGAVTRTGNVSMTVSLPMMSLLFAYNRISQPGPDASIGTVLMTMPFDKLTSFSAGVDGGTNPRQSIAIQRALPFDEGVGYRASMTNTEARTRVQAGAAVNLPVATVSGELVEQSHTRTSGRAAVSGSIALIEDKPFVTRQINDSFAMVRVPGIANAPILLNNHPAGITDEHGRLVLPRMSAYTPNTIRVDIDGLPPDVEVERDREVVVPPARSGVVATIAVQRIVGALVHVTDTSAKPLAAGAAVSIEPGGIATSVAQAGAFFVRGEPGRKRAIVTHRGVRCAFDFELTTLDAGTAYRNIGPFACAFPQ